MNDFNNMLCNPETLVQYIEDLIDSLSFNELYWCKRYLLNLYSKSIELGEAIRTSGASIIYSNDGDPESWEEAMNVARSGGVLKISSNRPSHWSMREITGGDYLDFYSLEPGGFINYKGPMTKYTKQLRFDGTDSVKVAIKNGTIIPGDIIGTKKHTFTILRVNKDDGSAIVFDGGHKFTNKCQQENKCAPILNYTPGITEGYKLYQIIRWTK